MKNINKILFSAIIPLSIASCNFNPINLAANQTTQGQNGFSISATNNSNADWMANLSAYIGNKSLRNIVIPGTHDSGTHSINEQSDFAPDTTVNSAIATLQSITDKINKIFNKKDSESNLKKFISMWSKTQSKSIYQQLESGIRYFDLRVLQKSNGEMYIVHGMYSDNMDIVIGDIKRFIKDHPKEIILLDFNHLYNMKNSHEKLIKKINDAFTDNGKNRMIPASRGINTTINQLWENNEQIIALYDDKESVSKHPELWPQSAIFSPWANKQDVNELKNSLQGILDGKLYNNSKQSLDCKKVTDCDKVSKEKFFVLQGILTPNAKLLVENLSIYLSYKRSEKDLAESTQDLAKVTKKLEEVRNKYNNASFFIKPFYGIELGAVAADKNITQGRFNSATADFKKAKAKYESKPNSLKHLPLQCLWRFSAAKMRASAISRARCRI